MAPSYLKEMFVYVKDICQRQSRSSADDKLYLVKPKTNYLKSSFAYSGAMVWNSLPRCVRNSSSLKKFKEECTRYIMIMRNGPII